MRPIYQIYVEEQLIDLDPKTIIAITYQAADLASGDLTSRKASFTNQIKAPVTNTNITIFEFANNPKSGSTFPYRKKMFKMLCNGIQTMEGVVIIKSFDTYFNLQFYSIPKDLSYRIANLYLSDLDFGDSPITWNAAFIDSKRASTTGWCAPVVSYGQIDPTVSGNLSIGTHYLPSVSYKDTITTILGNAGYTVSGTFYDDDLIFNNMVIIYGRKDFKSTTLKLNEALSTTLLQSDLLKDFLVKFGAFFRFNNNNIEIVTLEEILNDTGHSIDWTQKRVKNKKDVLQFTWNGLAKHNNFLYTEPDKPSGFEYLSNSSGERASGFLTVDNEILEQSIEIYTSIFEGPNWVKNGTSGTTPAFEVSEGTAANFVYCVTSSIWDAVPSSFTFDHEPKNILAVLDDRYAGAAPEHAVTYNGTSRSDYKVARFNNYYVVPNSFPSLAWRRIDVATQIGLLDTYYKSLQTIFTDGLITTAHEYYLTDMDINSLDLTIPIFDDGNYYMINKIVNYISGKTTRVELLKI